jgi:hypothetical protein
MNNRDFYVESLVEQGVDREVAERRYEDYAEEEAADDIGWLTDNTAIKVTKVSDLEMKAEELNGNRAVTITWDMDGNLYFGGKFIETEDFMAIIGMADMVADTTTGVAVFVGEGEMYS